MDHPDKAQNEAPVGGEVVKDPITDEFTDLLKETATGNTLAHAMGCSLADIKTIPISAIDEIDEYAAAGVTIAQPSGMLLAMIKGLSTHYSFHCCQRPRR